MTVNTPKYKYLYTFNSDYNYDELRKLEARQIFDKEEKDKLLFSNLKIDPSIGAFMRTRLDIVCIAATYLELLEKIKQENIRTDGFKVEYLTLEGDTLGNKKRLQKARDVGYAIEAEPEYYKPRIIYSICTYQDIWYFGILLKNNPDWHNHKRKPFSFSNSISMKIAKALVSIAAKGDTSKQLLDACCGVGTVLLEARFSGFQIEGCDINWKSCKHARNNLKHYNYTATVYCSDIKDLGLKYDAAIVDLPYNLYTYSDDEIMLNIIGSTAKLVERMVIVSISDIEPLIIKSELRVIDFCVAEKRGKSGFVRNVYVCEKEGNLK